MTPRLRFRIPLWTALLPLSVAGAALALPDHKTYDLVLGQSSTGARRINRMDGATLWQPAGVALDRAHGHLYVVDAGNGRVLGYRDAQKITTGAAADLILGQPDAVSSDRLHATARTLGRPVAATVDKDGTVWVADALHGRVVGFRYPFDSQRTADENRTADVVIGQLDMTAGYPDKVCNGGPDSAPGSSSAQRLCAPAGVATDSAGNLYVADAGNHRVLTFKAPTTVTAGAAADLIFGQAAKAGLPARSTCNRGATPAANTLCSPAGLLLRTEISGVDIVTRLYIADSGNHRVLVYDDPLGKQDAAARALLQPSLTDGTLRPGPDHVVQPVGLSFDTQNVLWISEAGQHRVTGFAQADLGPQNAAGGVPGTATYLIGQVDAFATAPNGGPLGKTLPQPTAATLSAPQGIAADTDGRLLVADSGNHRVLVYTSPTGTDSSATSALIALGQADLLHGGPNRTRSTGMAFPSGVTLDRTSAPGQIRVYVVDHGNSRILAWRDLSRIAGNPAPDLILGQTSDRDYACNGGGSPSASTLCWPRGATVDRYGDLWVADTWNHRVLRFPRPFEQQAQKPGKPVTADLVLGQSSFQWRSYNATSTSKPTARTLWSPVAVALDDRDTVWVADKDNGRVVGYALPLYSGMPATKVLSGQRAFDQLGCGERNTSLLCAPSGLAIDPQGNLWVADRDHHRVAAFRAPALNDAYVDPAPIALLGQFLDSDIEPNRSGAASERTLSAPEGVALETETLADGKAVLRSIVVADTGNHRVVAYPAAAFRPVASGVQADLRAVWGSGPARIFAVGQSGTITSFNGTAWREVPSGAGTASGLNAIWGSGPDLIWAVGNAGTIVQYKAALWRVVQGGTEDFDLRGVWGTGPTDVWAVGTGGTILHWDGVMWTPSVSGTTRDLYAVWGSTADDVWAVGAGGTVLRRVGGAWTAVTGGGATDLRAVWGSGASDIWIVGAGGTMLRWNGAALSAVTGQRPGNLTAVWGLGAKAVYAVDDLGNAYTWDGAALSVTKAGAGALAAVWGSRTNDLVAVGPGGTVLQLSAFGPGATFVVGQAELGTSGENRDAVYRDTAANVAQGLSAPRAVLVGPEGLLIADTGLVLPVGPVDTDKVAQPDFSSDTGNHRVLLVRAQPVVPDTPDLGTTPDLAQAVTPPPAKSGCSCDLGGAGAAGAGTSAALALLVPVLLGVRRRRRA